MEKQSNDICGTCGKPTKECQCLSNGVGKKNDGEKLDWAHFLWDEAEQIMDILQFGAKKYAWGNFAYVPNGKDRYFSALIRHLKEWKSGTTIDKESNKSTLAHAACCIMFLMYLDNHEIDDNNSK